MPVPSTDATSTSPNQSPKAVQAGTVPDAVAADTVAAALVNVNLLATAARRGVSRRATSTSTTTQPGIDSIHAHIRALADGGTSRGV